MIFYHGTTLKAAEAIKKEGLKPHRETRFRLFFPELGREMKDSDGVEQEENVVYLVQDPRNAKEFVNFRALYERAPINTKLIWSDGEPFGIKNVAERDPDAKPAVVVVDIPNQLASKLDADTQSDYGIVCRCVIPPQYIKAVRPLPFIGDTWGKNSRSAQGLSKLLSLF